MSSGQFDTGSLIQYGRKREIFSSYRGFSGESLLNNSTNLSKNLTKSYVPQPISKDFVIFDNLLTWSKLRYFIKPVLVRNPN